MDVPISPARVIWALLVARGFAVTEAAATGAPGEWIASYHDMPSDTLSRLAVYNAGTDQQGKAMRTGDVAEYYDVQIQFRHGDGNEAVAKGKDIIAALDPLWMESVAVPGDGGYTIQCFNRRGDVTFLKQGEQDRLQFYYLNGLVTMWRA